MLMSMIYSLHLTSLGDDDDDYQTSDSKMVAG